METDVQVTHRYGCFPCCSSDAVAAFRMMVRQREKLGATLKDELRNHRTINGKMTTKVQKVMVQPIVRAQNKN